MQYEGDILVSGSTDCSVRVWDIPSGQCLHIFLGHTATVRCLLMLKPALKSNHTNTAQTVMSKEPLFITGSRDATLRVWKLPCPSNQQVLGSSSAIPSSPIAQDVNPYFQRVMAGHENNIRDIAAHGDTLISGSFDCTIGVWQISSGNLRHRLRGHTQKIYSVDLDHKRGQCISGSMDRSIRVWSVDTGDCLFTLHGHNSLVGFLNFSHGYLVSAGPDGRLRVWDPDYQTSQSILFEHNGAVTCFQHDGQKVISAGGRILKMWDIATGRCVRDVLDSCDGIWQVGFDKEKCVAAVQRDGMTYIEVCPCEIPKIAWKAANDI